MKAVVRLTASSYEIDDIIQIFPDNYVFAGDDLANGRSVIPLGVLTDSEVSLLTMIDNAPRNSAAISQLPTFRSLATSNKNLMILHRRKYNFDNGVKLKANAQDRV